MKKKISFKPTNLFLDLIGVIIGIFHVYIIYYLDETLNFGLFKSLLFMIIILIINTFISILLHEFGHFLMGKLSNYELLFFRIGPVAFVKTNGKIKLKKYQIKGTGGQCLMAPRESFNNFSYKLYFSGGIIINLLLCILSIIMTIKTNSLLYVYFLNLLAINLIILITNAIPFKNYIPNDASTIKKMSENEDFKFIVYLSLIVSKLMINGKSIANISSELIEKLENLDDNIGEKYAYLGDYYDAIGQYEKSTEIYEKAINKEFMMGKIQKYTLFDMLVFNYVYLNQTDKIEPLITDEYKEIKKVLNLLPQSIASNYAYYLYKNDEINAKKSLDMYNQMKNKHVFEAEIEQIDIKMDKLTRK